MCNITIDDVIGIGPNPLSIRVSGTVSDCEADVEGVSVIVAVSCQEGAPPFAEQAANVSSGNWIAIFPAPLESECKCEGRVFVTACCATDENCAAPPASFSLRCPECPEVSIGVPEPEDVKCLPDGTATIKHHAIIENNTPLAIIAFLECGSNPPGILHPPGSTNSIGVTSGDTQQLVVTCRYPTPSTPKPFIRFTDFAGNDIGCPDVPFPEFPLQACPCPQVTNLIVSSVDKCVATFEGTFEADATDCVFVWEFGDNSPEVTTTVPQVSHTYQSAGTFAVAVTAKCGDCSETTTVVVEITDCVPPAVGACCLPDGSCEIVSQAECNSMGGKYQGDGSDCKECTDDDDCGKPTVALAIAQALLISVGVIITFLKFCMNAPVPGWLYGVVIGLAAGPLLVWAVYELLCKLGVIKKKCCFNNCDRLFMGWIPLVSAGIVALYLSGCCDNWWKVAVVAAFLVSGLLLFWKWVADCNPSRCQIAAAWVVVLVSSVGVAFAFIKILINWTSWPSPELLEQLQTCPLGWVEIAVLVASAALGYIITKCIFQPEAPNVGQVTE